MAFKYGSPAHSAALAADEEWSEELRRAFGKRAGDVRYTKIGHGEPGSALRQAYDAYVVARDAWHVECAAPAKPTVINDGMGGEYRPGVILALD